MLSNEDFFAVGAFYKLEYLSCLAVMLPKVVKSLFALSLHHVLGVTKIGVQTKIAPNLI
jgi:hypothetical protein